MSKRKGRTQTKRAAKVVEGIRGRKPRPPRDSEKNWRAPKDQPRTAAKPAPAKPEAKRTRRNLDDWRAKVVAVLAAAPKRTMRPSDVGRALHIEIPKGAHTNPAHNLDAWTLLSSLVAKGLVERTEGGYHLLDTTATAKAR
jgi:hypothetical protein